MPLRLAPNLGDYLLLAALALMWGSAFLLIKIAVATVPPFSIVAGRLVLGMVFTLVYILLIGDRLPTAARDWGVFAIIALLGNVIPFALIGWGELRIDSALAAIMIATVPLFTSVLAHYFTDDEPLSVKRFAGVLVGLVGVVMLVGWDALAGIGATVLSQLAIIVAAFSYACTNIVARRAVTGSTGSASAAALIMWHALVRPSMRGRGSALDTRALG